MYNLYRIKKLEWDEENGIQKAVTSFCSYLAYKDHCEFYLCDSDEYDIWFQSKSLVDSKEIAEKHLFSMIEYCLEKVDCRSEVEED